MEAVAERREPVVTLASLSARILADAQRSFAEVDAAILEQQVHEVVSLLWTESPRVTSFIPVLALRDLRERLHGATEPAQA